jgi:hypothetical protein
MRSRSTCNEPQLACRCVCAKSSIASERAQVKKNNVPFPRLFNIVNMFVRKNILLSYNSGETPASPAACGTPAITDWLAVHSRKRQCSSSIGCDGYSLDCHLVRSSTLRCCKTPVGVGSPLKSSDGNPLASRASQGDRETATTTIGIITAIRNLRD